MPFSPAGLNGQLAYKGKAFRWNSAPFGPFFFFSFLPQRGTEKREAFRLQSFTTKGHEDARSLPAAKFYHKGTRRCTKPSGCKVLPRSATKMHEAMRRNLVTEPNTAMFLVPYAGFKVLCRMASRPLAALRGKQKTSRARGSPSKLRRMASCIFVALRGQPYHPHGFMFLRGPSWSPHPSARLRASSWPFVVNPAIRMASCIFVALRGQPNHPHGFVYLRGPSWLTLLHYRGAVKTLPWCRKNTTTVP